MPSKHLDLPVADLVELLPQLSIQEGLVVEVAAVLLGQSVGVAEHVTALALHPQQSGFLAAAEATLPVLLLRLVLHLGLFRFRDDRLDFFH